LRDRIGHTDFAFAVDTHLRVCMFRSEFSRKTFKIIEDGEPREVILVKSKSMNERTNNDYICWRQ
jgi:hypothetical protein